jgi:hypothetical protein
MKYLMSLAILSAFLFIGCADTSIAPIELDNNSYQLTKPPLNEVLSVENTFSVTRKINGDEGGSIKLKKSYVVLDGHIVKIDVKFNVKKYFFSGDVDVTTTAGDIYGAVMLTPYMEEKNYS